MTEIGLAGYLEIEVERFMLVFMRLFGLLLFAPIFSARVMPTTFRVYLAIAMTLLFAGVVPVHITGFSTMISMVVVMVSELVVGLILGSFVQFIFAGLQLAGQMTGTQLGLALASVINPQFDDQSSTNSVIYATLASLIFFVTGLDREMFRVLFDTFTVIPPGELYFRESVMGFVMTVVQQSMVFSVRIAAPVIVALFMAELAMGFVGRTVPQLNILSVGFSIRIFLGLFITAVGLSDLGYLFYSYVGDAFIEAVEAIRTLAPDG